MYEGLISVQAKLKEEGVTEDDDNYDERRDDLREDVFDDIYEWMHENGFRREGVLESDDLDNDSEADPEGKLEPEEQS